MLHVKLDDRVLLCWAMIDSVKASLLPCLRASKDSVTLNLIVSPRASRTKLLGIHGDRLKISIAAPPDDNQANEALLSFLKEALKIPASRIILSAGHKSKRKSVTIANISAESVIAALHKLFD